MVCRPHQYIISSLAQGGLQYPRQTQNYAQSYGTLSKTSQYGMNYAPVRIKDAQQYAPTYIARQSYQSAAIGSATRTTLEELPIAETAATFAPQTLFTFNQPTIRKLEEPMPQENIRAKKQKLAQKILAELEKFGPREEHTHDDHEHGPLTHVH